MNPDLPDLEELGRLLQLDEANLTGNRQRAQVTNRNMANRRYPRLEEHDLTGLIDVSGQLANANDYQPVDINRAGEHNVQPWYGQNYQASINGPRVQNKRNRYYPLENAIQARANQSQPVPNGMQFPVPPFREADVDLRANGNIVNEVPPPNMARVQIGNNLRQNDRSMMNQGQGSSIARGQQDAGDMYVSYIRDFITNYERQRGDATVPSYNDMAQGMPFGPAQNNKNFAVPANPVCTCAPAYNSGAYQNPRTPRVIYNIFMDPAVINPAGANEPVSSFVSYENGVEQITHNIYMGKRQLSSASDNAPVNNFEPNQNGVWPQQNTPATFNIFSPTELFNSQDAQVSSVSVAQCSRTFTDFYIHRPTSEGLDLTNWGNRNSSAPGCAHHADLVYLHSHGNIEQHTTQRTHTFNSSS